MSDNKMTAEQALMMELYCWRSERPDERKMDEIIRLAEKAISEPMVPRLTEHAIQRCYDALYNADGNDAHEHGHKALIRAHWNCLIDALAASPEPVAPAAGGSWEEETHS